VDGETTSQASYIVYCQGRKVLSSGLSDDELHRTGRWNEDEVDFVDQLVTNFDQGLLPIPDGSRLSSFLGDILLCKASRLTKKMKNAKLSSRSFVLSSASRDVKPGDCQMLSALQERFVMSLPSLSAQLEMRFNLARQWRAYFSDLCVAVGYPYLDVADWIASLEELESRAAQAETRMRTVRRRRVGLVAGGCATSAVPTAIAITSSLSQVGGGGGTARPQAIGSFMERIPGVISSQSLTHAGMSTAPTENDSDDASVASEGTFDDLLSDSPNDISDQLVVRKSLTSALNPNGHDDDFDSAMRFLAGLDSMNMIQQTRQKPRKDFRDWFTSGNPFLEAIAVYLEERNLPFEYVDCWVPSLAHEDAGNDVRLLPAGFVARDDQGDSMASALRAFGEYSKSFSFKPGKGLPGRVYKSGESSWQPSLSNVHPSVFARVGGAKVYGLKTAAAIPFSAPGVGRLIVVMYSTLDLPEDTLLTKQFSMELSKYSPQPKWKLVIEIGPGDESKDLSTSIQELNDADCDPNVSRDGESANGMQSSGHASSHSDGESTYDRSVEIRIATFLGDQIPSLDSKPSTAGESSSSLDRDTKEFLPDIMGMRLLLLRPASRRSPEENDAIDIVKSSFMNYTEKSQRSNGEIAILLAREWSCLRPSAQLPPSQGPWRPTVPRVSFVEETKLPSTTGPAEVVPETYKSHTLTSTIATGVDQAGSMRPLIHPFNVSFEPTPLPHNGTMLIYDHSIRNNNVNSVFH
jgi:hypothetical protein